MRGALRWWALLAFVASCCDAADLTVSVTDAREKGIADVVVIASSDSLARPTTKSASAIMDQLNKEFVPEILVIRTGTAVLFPNSDSVAHQVYSFSPAKRFELPLYRGRPHPPVIFDQPGIVTLGCNIHDHMVGYIVVTDSPYFAKTDASGHAVLKGLSDGEYKISAWHPRFNEAVQEQKLSIGGDNASGSFRLVKPMQSKNRQIDERRIRDY